MASGDRFSAVLVVEPGETPAIIRLRRAMKVLLRSFRVRVVELTPQKKAGR